MICYIPSKGRPKTNTYKLFQEVGIEAVHFIETSKGGYRNSLIFYPLKAFKGLD